MKPKISFEKLWNKNSKWTKVIICIGIVGIILILLSSFWPKTSGGKKETTAETKAVSAEEYTLALEDKLKKMIGGIDGVGYVNVMVTLENGVENVYANSEKKSTNNSKDSTNSGNKATDKSDTQQDIVIISDGSNKEALVVTQREPTVKGVVVVCDGGDRIEVKQNVIDAVTTALNIKSNRVSVIKSSNK